MIPPLRATLKLFGFFALCLLAVPLQALILLFHKGHCAYIVPNLWHKGLCAVFGIHGEIKGAPLKNRQVLYLSNHLSYLDIPLLGGMLGPSSFVAKSEVSGWPVFGYLSKLQQTVFIRRARSAAAREIGALDIALREGKSLTIFPEGTSTDGRSVIPFKSSLFAIPLQAEWEDLMIQPVTISLLSVDGKPPDTQEIRDLYAWHRGMDTPLGAHLWRFARTSGAKLRVTFHPPMRSGDFSGRKELAQTCFEAVCRGLDIPAAPLGPPAAETS